MFKKLTVYILFVGLLCVPVSAGRDQTISVYGSSVASGVAAEDNEGYWYMLHQRLAHDGWTVSSCSRGGDRTTRILDRFDDLLSQEPAYVFIGLSLANEGLRTPDKAQQEQVYRQYAWGMQALIALLRSRGMTPVVGLCYPHGEYTPEEYAYVKRMNVLINSWDVPSANFLGVLDDGRGRWVDGFWNDAGHPNTAGHRELYYTIVPSLFAALEAGKPTPRQAGGEGYLSLDQEHPQFVRYQPEDPIHSWAMALRFRCEQDGRLAAIVRHGDPVYLSIIGGRLVYRAGPDANLAGPTVRDGRWHQAVLSHGYARGWTQLFVDGKWVGSVNGQVEPREFVLGGHAGRIDLKDWLVYRSALNETEVQALHAGELLQASLEIYAPLQESALTPGQPVENRAQSLSQAIYGVITP